MKEFLRNKLNRNLLIVMTLVMLGGAMAGILLGDTGSVEAIADTNDNGETAISYEDKVSILESIYDDRDNDGKLVILELVPAKENTIFSMLTCDAAVYNKFQDQSEAKALYDAYSWSSTSEANSKKVAGGIASFHPFTVDLVDGTYIVNYPNFFIDELIDAVTYPELYDYFTERNADGSYKHLEVRTYIPGELNVLYEEGGETALNEVLEDVSLIYISDQLQNVEVAYFNEYIAGNMTAADTLNVGSSSLMMNYYTYSSGTYTQSKITAAQSATYLGYYNDTTVLGATDFSTDFGKAFSAADKVASGESVTYTFTNYTDGAENWDNFLVYLSSEESSNAAPTGDYGVVRADNYGWCGELKTDKNPDELGWTLESNWNWDTFTDDLDGASVELTVENKGDGTADVLISVTTASGTSYYQNYKGIAVDADSLYVNLSVEKAYLVFDNMRTCDLSWDVAELLIEYIYGGSRYTNYEQGGETVIVPVSTIFNYGSLSKSTNMFKFIDFLCKTSNVATDTDSTGESSYWETVLANHISTVTGTSSNGDTFLKGAYTYKGTTYAEDWSNGNVPFFNIIWSNTSEYAYNYVFKTSNQNDSVFMMGSPNQSVWRSVSGSSSQGRIELSTDSSGKSTYMISNVINYFLGTDLGLSRVIRVLEIEPCSDYIYDYENASDTTEKTAVFEAIKTLAVSLHMKDFYHMSSYSDYDSYLESNQRFEFTCVTTADFNGMNEDLLSEYDMIIVGAETGLLNTINGVTQYNDTDLNGYIYLAYGDLVKVDSTLLGYQPDDYTTLSSAPSGYTVKTVTTGLSNRYSDSLKWVFAYGDGSLYSEAIRSWASTHYSWRARTFAFVRDSVSYYTSKSYSSSTDYYSDTFANARFSSNDITEKKKAELLAFTEAGKPVILADEVYDSSLKKVYPTANLYEYSQTVAGSSYENVLEATGYKYSLVKLFRASEFTIDGYAMYQSSAKTESDRVYNVSYDSNGLVTDILTSHNFYYDVDLTTRAGYDYTMKLMIDQNADGLFNEEITSDSVIELFYSKSGIGSGRTSFKITLPTDYNGMFYWRIVVEESKNGEVTDRKNIDGANVVTCETSKKIKVLQILPDNVDGKNGKPVTLNMSTNSDFNALLEAAESQINYEIQIDTLTATEFESKYTSTLPYDAANAEATSYLLREGYSMVVIGFADIYSGDDISDEHGAATSIRDFIEMGKSVLFTHDTISYSNNVNHGNVITSSGSLSKANGNTWDTDLTRVLRNIVGLDPYDVTLDLSGNEFVPTDTAGNKITEISGLTDFVLYRYSLAGTQISVDGVRSATGWSATTDTGLGYTYGKTVNTSSYVGSLKTSTTVTQINRGQLTMYPYQITSNEVGSSFTVATTHSQWCAVDLEDPEIVVWYTLSSSDEGTYYGDDTMDAANNYYIYSKNNITYSGAGHSTVNGETELKLFVNTIIRAAVASVYEPELTVTNGSKSKNTYIVYSDEDADGDGSNDVLEENVGSYVVYCTSLDDEIEIDFRCTTEGLANYEVLYNIMEESQIHDYLSKYKSCEIYYLEPLSSGSNVDLVITEHLATYTTGASDDEGFERSVYLNGEERSFVIFDGTATDDQNQAFIDTYDELTSSAKENYMKYMHQCYTEALAVADNGRQYALLYITAEDANGNDASTVVKVVKRNLSQLD